MFFSPFFSRTFREGSTTTSTITTSIKKNGVGRKDAVSRPTVGSVLGSISIASESVKAEMDEANEKGGPAGKLVDI